ncbi:MAG: YicC family protein [Bacteroidetes bacterium]|nr:MAG: YicC family protein [Bacteroidota bacterium]
MTGFGKASCELKNKIVNIEVKSLNSKYLDLNLRLPSVYREKDLELRNFLGHNLERGKVDLSINQEMTDATNSYSINKKLVKQYYQEIQSLSSELKTESNDIMSVVLKMPEVVSSEKDALTITEWKKIVQSINKALANLDNFRITEGKNLEKDLTSHVKNIDKKMNVIESFADKRIKLVKSRLLKNLNEVVQKNQLDKDRLEQELVYYMEKYDINEEIVRLRSHCTYFLKILKESKSNGKKLGFIGQEMGREINTIGSKANDATIQKSVVEMKDELEKIKEQVLNVL